MAYNTFCKIKGFTLIELMVVLTIGIALTGIAVKSASDFAFVARYEQTSEMATRIKSAIIGSPGKYINGQPDISGYVADMGRTPEYLRGLLQAGYCRTAGNVYVAQPSSALCVGNVWDWAETPCVNKADTAVASGFNTEATCTPSTTYQWIGVSFDSAKKLKHGWNGPYLQTSKLAGNNAALGDGWGNSSSDNQYGWILGLASNVGDTLSIKSKGKDQLTSTDGCLVYEDDCAYEIPGNLYTKNVGTLPLALKINADETALPSYISPSLTGFCTDTDPTYTDLATCNLIANRNWDNSISKCLKTDDTITTEAACSTSIRRWDTDLSVCLQTLASSTQVDCVNTLLNKWEVKIVTPAPPVHPTQNICMRIHFRVDGAIQSITSTDQPSITRNGSEQDLSFDFSSTAVPSGINAMGIYVYGTCSVLTYKMQKECEDNSETWTSSACSNNEYPTGHAVQHVTFAPYKSIDNLIW